MTRLTVMRTVAVPSPASSNSMPRFLDAKSASNIAAAGPPCDCDELGIATSSSLIHRSLMTIRPGSTPAAAELTRAQSGY
jgi:hypothetical protein